MKKLLLLSTVLCCTLSGAASSAYAEVISRIEVVGTQRIEPKTVLSYLTVRSGDEFTNQGLDDSLKALYETGLFADVNLRQNGQTLVVQIVENPIINEIAFEGNKRIEDNKLGAEVRLKPRSVFTKAKVQADVTRIQDVYRRSGRFAAKVEPQLILLDQNRVNLVFEIDEGPQTLIKRITFVNNKAFPDSELRTVVASAEEAWYRFLSTDDSYDPDRIEYDSELLRRFYNRKGYADFNVTSSIAELSQDKEGFFLTFTVDEGPRYKFGKLTVSNRLEGLDVKDFEDNFSMDEGDWYDSSEVDETVEALTLAAEAQMFPFVRVVADKEFDRTTNTININFVIQEGSRSYVDRIEIKGNVRTMDKVIRRQFQLAEGDPFNRERLRESETKIRDLNYFENINVETTPGDAPDQTNVVVNVAEKSTGELSIGAGFSTADGPLADFSIRERNFLGRGQEVGVSTTLAGERSQIDLSFVEPYFLNRDLRFSSNLFHVRRDLQDESSYNQERTGLSLGIGYPLSKYLRHSFNYRIINNKISDVQNTASFFIRAQEGERLTSAVGHTLSYDTRNSKMDPTDGYILSLTNEVAGLGGDAKFVNSEVSASYFRPVYDDWILNLSARSGYIFSYAGDEVAINDRYFLGDNSFRGFESSGIGPRDILTDDALGGSQYYKGTVELAFPIGMPEEYGIKGHAFSDFGSLWGLDSKGPSVADESSLRISAGIGFSWKSPLGPIRLDFATPIKDEEYDLDQLVSFSFGTKF